MSALEPVLGRAVRFESRPSALPADVRTVWRVPLVLLVIATARGQRATWQQLHVLNWAVRGRDARERLRRYLAGEITPDSVVVRYEPALEDAIALCVGLGFAIWHEGKRLILTKRGEQAVAAIRASEALGDERGYLTEVGPRLSQAAVERLLVGGQPLRRER
jgi:hypothetical protein